MSQSSDQSEKINHQIERHVNLNNNDKESLVSADSIDLSEITISQQDEKASKRNRIIQSTISTSFSTNNPVYLEFHGINYFVPINNETSNSARSNRDRWLPFLKSFQTRASQSDEEIGESGQNQILHNVHGCAKPGEILAIMGPSGCGKTTLLNILGDRVSKRGISGTINMNGRRPTKETKRFVAYCAQDDIFFPQLTVRETLSFTARLRLPRDMPKREKLRQVENTIQLLNLSKCADTKIGDSWSRGISGGERKRASIGSELLTDPSVILLDEPTSGLDSSFALELIKILKEFAIQQHKTIIMVIHQPSSQVFELFDKLLLMADGHVVYFGERANVVNYLNDQKCKCHPNFNPADYIMELLNDPTSKQKLIQAYARHVKPDPTGEQLVKKHSNLSRDVSSLPALDDSIISSSPLKMKHLWEATFLQQVIILTERSFRQRSKVILSKLDLLQTLSLVLFGCIIWFQLPYKESSIQDRYGSIFFTSVYWSFYPMMFTISSFPLDLTILNKERQSRSYRLLSYFFSKQVAELPLSIVHPAIFVIVVYWVSGLVADGERFIAYLLVVLLTTLTAQSFGYLIGATLLNVQKALSVASVFMLSTMLLAGFYVRNLVSELSWLKYL
ncbi:4005_t:CDS:10, partial [Acaulospora morrowiae]